MQLEQQRQRAEEAARQAAELAACQKAAETEAARQAIAAKVTSSCCLPSASLNNPSLLLEYNPLAVSILKGIVILRVWSGHLKCVCCRRGLGYA